MALRLGSSFPAGSGDEGKALSAMTELTSCVELHFNNIRPFIIKSAIFPFVSIQCEQNARLQHKYRENWGTLSNTKPK